ncbi:unnamed protein product [Cylicocyclus nassatus]|uniref:Uncharacterized protein n=1 Tax=Cylicocyclus nassatus TaxID=53992 RepID=A0AA36GII3_CYLNA|nr:unnamed protein product [Cylicocyclus nassatus]
MAYVSCVKQALGATRIWPGKLRIYRRAHGWVRDGFYTTDKWCDYDFMLHGWKLQTVGDEGWESPFRKNLDPSKCGEGTEGWDWILTKHVNATVIKNELAPYEKYAGDTFPNAARRLMYITMPDVGKCYPNSFITTIGRNYLQRYGRRWLILDDTFNVTKYSFRLATIAAADDAGNGFPSKWFSSTMRSVGRHKKALKFYREKPNAYAITGDNRWAVVCECRTDQVYKIRTVEARDCRAERNSHCERCNICACRVCCNCYVAYQAGVCCIHAHALATFCEKVASKLSPTNTFTRVGPKPVKIQTLKTRFALNREKSCRRKLADRNVIEETRRCATPTTQLAKLGVSLYALLGWIQRVQSVKKGWQYEDVP